MLQRVMSRTSIFCGKFFCLTVPNNFVGEHFSVTIILGTENVWIRGGGLSRFSSNFFVSQCLKFRRGILYCCINFGMENVRMKEGGSIKNFRQKLFLSECRTISVRGIPSVFH